MQRLHTCGCAGWPLPLLDGAPGTNAVCGLWQLRTGWLDVAAVHCCDSCWRPGANLCLHHELFVAYVSGPFSFGSSAVWLAVLWPGRTM